MINRWQQHTGPPPEIAHRELVDRAFLYLKFSLNCKVVFKERVASAPETPDAIGFHHGGFSALVECKTSKADFAADKKKYFRRDQSRGMGHKRFYMAPVGLLKPSEILYGWGLLEVYDKPPRFKTRPVIIAKESEVFSERNLQAEISYLTSAIRRIDISMAVFVQSHD